MNWYLKVINNYRDFAGRARRKEYWTFVLINLMFSMTAAFLDRIFGIAWGDWFWPFKSYLWINPFYS